jgi:hypothetical protein
MSVPYNFSYPDNFGGLYDVGCVGCGTSCVGCTDGLGVLGNTKTPKVKKMKQPKMKIARPFQLKPGATLDPSGWTSPNRDYVFEPIKRPAFESPPLIPPRTETPGKSSWYAKGLDALLAYNRDKAARDVAIAQAGMQINGRDPNVETTRPQPDVMNAGGQVANAGEFAGRAAGSFVDTIVGFVSQNPLIVGLCVVGLFLLFKEPPKKR